MPAAFMEALLDGRRADAELLLGIAVPEGWPEAHDARFLRLRAGQLRDDPARAEWPVFAVVLPRRNRPMIGHAGFHGPPGVNAPRKAGAVEIGYTIFETHRGNGYATEAARALIAWARSRHDIGDVIASVAPDNAPSLALLHRLGFRQTGTQWDDEDGEELVFELQLEGGTGGHSQDTPSN
jgi:[ribosomal protein S5]-alanine N-acetyltransferase